MNESDTASIFNFHNKVIAAYGAGTVDALGWISAESQLARYQVLSKLADFTGHSILDAGCGYADLLKYLGSLLGNIQYIGIEQMPALLKVAVERYGHLPNTHFLKSDFSESVLPAADYVIACGSLSYRNSDAAYVFNMIEKLFTHCRMGFGFNLLSHIVYPDPAITCYNPDVITKFCKTLTNNIRVEDGYWDNDFTVFMYH